MDFFEIILQQKLAGKSSGGGGSELEDALVTGTLSEYRNDRVTSIGSCAFYSYSSLISIDFPNVTDIGSFAFQYCYNLTDINFPNAINIGAYAFSFCTNLTNLNLPNVTDIERQAFYQCSNLTNISFPNVTYISSSAFCGCKSLMSIYLLSSSIPTLFHINAFYTTPMSNSTYTGSFGSIYVPTSLVDAYKSASNWSTYKNRITAYEGE